MTHAWTSELIAHAKRLAATHGFDRAGVAATHAASDPQGRVSAERFEAWVDNGYAGEMQYLTRRNEAGELVRRSAQIALPWARSVLVCALNYNLGGAAGGATGRSPRSIDQAAPGTGWIARYAWTGTEDGGPVDYHDDMLRRLLAVEAGLREFAPCETRCYVDTGPLLERDLAARAGIGWIGRNTCVINEELGSWLLLGVIVTSLPMENPVAIAEDRCGSCTRCIDSCPTDALLKPTPDNPTRQMDASRCIAYLTIEKKGEVPLDLREKVGRQVFGCDICQDVCPWNRRAPVAEIDGLQRREELINPALEWLAALDRTGFREQFGGSPLERTKRHRLHRNVAIAMGNSGERSFLPRLEQWTQAEDADLRESAIWAIDKLKAPLC